MTKRGGSSLNESTTGSNFGSKSIGGGLLIASEQDQISIKTTPLNKSYQEDLLLKSENSENTAKSPFKNMVKQKPIEADNSVVPMETETNVKDDDADST